MQDRLRVRMTTGEFRSLMEDIALAKEAEAVIQERVVEQMPEDTAETHHYSSKAYAREEVADLNARAQYVRFIGAHIIDNAGWVTLSMDDCASLEMADAFNRG